MSATIPNPLRCTAIPPELLADNAEERIHDSTTFEPFAFITTKQHPTLPLCIHNYNHRSFWTSSPLLSHTTPHQQQTLHSQAVLSDQTEGSLALTLASRSLVTERSTGKVISRSFAKFFNSDEEMAYRPTGFEYAYEIQEKIDGSIISLFWYDGLERSSSASLHQGQWVIASRASFSSRHTESAWNIINTRFSALVSNTRTSRLDKSKTYVFELVDNRMPIKIHYSYGLDLVLLAIIGNDGSETTLSNSGLPFRTPRIWRLEELIEGGNGARVTASNIKQLGKLPRANEEGFVIMFWRTKDDVYPQRVKVKLESYLKLCKPADRSGPEPGTAIDLPSRRSLKHLAKFSGPTPKMMITNPPSPRALLKVYASHRTSIPSFSGIDACMSSVKQRLLDAVRSLNVSDDYGGEAWLAKIAKIWDRIHALSSLHEMNWKDTVKMLEGEGFRSRPHGKNGPTLRLNFDNRIRGRDVDRSLISSLKAWFEGQSIQEIVSRLVESAEFPNDLKSTEIVVLGSMSM